HDIANDQNAGFFKLGQGDLHLYRLSKPEKSVADFITLFYLREKKQTCGFHLKKPVVTIPVTPVNHHQPL
ncbi:MAG: hypothetical protein ACRC25_17995, partial [Aeromonas hydrophila]